MFLCISRLLKEGCRWNENTLVAQEQTPWSGGWAQYWASGLSLAAQSSLIGFVLSWAVHYGCFLRFSDFPEITWGSGKRLWNQASLGSNNKCTTFWINFLSCSSLICKMGLAHGTRVVTGRIGDKVWSPTWSPLPVHVLEVSKSIIGSSCIC